MNALDLNLHDMLDTVLEWLIQDVQDNGPGPSGGRQLRVDRVRDALLRHHELTGATESRRAGAERPAGAN